MGCTHPHPLLALGWSQHFQIRNHEAGPPRPAENSQCKRLDRESPTSAKAAPVELNFWKKWGNPNPSPDGTMNYK